RFAGSTRRLGGADDALFLRDTVFSSSGTFESGRVAGGVLALAGADAAGRAGSAEVSPISSIDPPASRSASSRSSAACFITVRSSGGGRSFFESVSGKNDDSAAAGGAGGSGSDAALAAIAPKPIMVPLRVFSARGAG